MLDFSPEEISFYLYALVGLGVFSLVAWVAWLDRETD